MESGSAGYVYLGIPERLAEVLWTTVHEMQGSLSAKDDRASQLAGAALSRCVQHFACVHREHGEIDLYPEVSCSEVFHLFAEQLMQDTTADEWCVPRHMVPVVSSILVACGQLVVDRMSHDVK
ncbi:MULTISPECIES: hypothetical protein [unclassified Caballeronia]|uniref:hypothetical protein n=1 Tax=unclassified Caballeronia TaxID=2646786 RepID=UPI002858DF77|nr:MULTISPECIES: hypothetical protein [unclassified Caballeronia]MDR5784470.1 hypothetical protein [Caballeronia sp. LZ065]MDR5822429.1 hypothetical protein [Caballeronia sp. LZ043]